MPPELLTAAEWAAMLRDPTRDRRYVTAAQLGGEIAAYLSWARNEAGKAPRTLDQYERDLARLALMFPEHGRADIGKEELRAWLASFPEGSRSRVWAVGRSFWGWQYDEERVERNPMRGIRRPKLREHLIVRVFEPDEVRALLGAAESTDFPSLDRARLLLLLDTGARKSEALRFRLEDANLRRRVIRLYGKGSRERLVPATRGLAAALAAAMLEPLPLLRRPLGDGDHLWFPVGRTGPYGAREGGLLWLDPSRPLSPPAFHRWWKELVAAAGIRYRKPHTTRHTYATELLDATGDLVAVRDALGHSSTKTTEVYLHHAQRRLSRAVEELEGHRTRLHSEDAVLLENAAEQRRGKSPRGQR